MINVQIKAIIKFETGPAKATIAISCKGLLKFLGSTGTGLAQPKIKPVPVINNKPGTIIVPNKSTCLTGFKVNLPNLDAVLSPYFFATQPCATSCTVIAKITGNIHTAMRWITLNSSIIYLSSLNSTLAQDPCLDGQSLCHHLKTQS